MCFGVFWCCLVVFVFFEVFGVVEVFGGVWGVWFFGAFLVFLWGSLLLVALTLSFIVPIGRSISPACSFLAAVSMPASTSGFANSISGSC